MQPQIIENRVNEILRQVTAGKQVEDFRFELKRDWPTDYQKAARIIAGHANAASPEPVFWIIGVDDKTGAVHPLSAVNVANWYPQICKAFENGFAPDLLRDMQVQTPSGPIHVLVFETDRAPYVVNVSGAGGNTHEVPWRKGTNTWSAGRAELLRLLVPAISMPKHDVLDGLLRAGPSMMANEERDPIHVWMVEASVYLVPPRSTTIHAQHRKTSVWVTLPDGSEFVTFDAIHFDGITRDYVHADGAQFVLSDAGVLKIVASGKRNSDVSFPKDLTVHFRFELVEIEDRPLEFSFPINLVSQKKEGVHSMAGRKVQEIVRYELLRL